MFCVSWENDFICPLFRSSLAVRVEGRDSWIRTEPVWVSNFLVFLAIPAIIYILNPQQPCAPQSLASVMIY